MHHTFFVARISYPLIATALLLGAAAPLHAQNAAALTVDEALQLAAQRSQQLLAQDAAAAAAREMAMAAGQAPDLTLTAGINNLPIEGPDEFSLTNDFMTMRSIGLMRELTRHDKRAARAARFAREADAAEAGRTLALANLERETAMAWFDRYYRERMRDVLAMQRDQAALQIEAADLAYRSGLGAQSDVFAARASSASIEDRMAETERDVDIAVTRLARWVGAAAERPLGPLPPMDVVSLSPGDLDAELGHHPQIVLMLSQEEIARAEAEIARTESRSDWTIEVMYSERGPSFADMMSFNVSMPLQRRERSRQDRVLAASLATAEQMRAEREEETREHVADARALLQAWQANRARLDRYASALIPLAAERTVAATVAYGSGTGTLTAVLDARFAEIDTRIDALDLEMETAALWAGINYLIPADHSAAHE